MQQDSLGSMGQTSYLTCVFGRLPDSPVWLRARERYTEFLRFGGMLWVFRAAPELFTAGWFIEAWQLRHSLSSSFALLAIRS
jgi:hypothetical protein